MWSSGIRNGAARPADDRGFINKTAEIQTVDLEAVFHEGLWRASNLSEEDEGSKQKREFAGTRSNRDPRQHYRKTVQESFDVVLPLVCQGCWRPQKSTVSLANLKKWLEQNAPKNSD